MKHFFSIALVCTIVAAAWPVTTSAAYTFHGRTFATFDEMVKYTREHIKTRTTLQSSTGTDLPGASSGTKDTLSALNISRGDAVTGPAYDIDVREARLIGTIEFDDAKYVKAWFVYGTNPNLLDQETPYELHDRTRSRMEYDSKLRGLQHNTRYYYRAVISDENGKRDYGKLRSFRTPIEQGEKEALVRVYSGGSTDVDDTRATFKGELYFRENAQIIAWFEWGEDVNDLDQRSPRVTYRGDGTSIKLDHTAYDLEPDTDYVYRFVGVYSDGTQAWGRATKFHTARERKSKEKAEIKAGPAKDITDTSAVVSVVADMNDYKNGTVFILYGEDGDAIKEAFEDFRSYDRIRERGDALRKALLDDDLDRKQTYTYTLRYLDQDTNHRYAFGLDYSEGLVTTFPNMVRTKRTEY